jgi:hypothetical protein
MAGMMRRALLGGAAACLLAPTAGAAPASAIEFQVLRNGRDIGRHRLAFRRDGQDLVCAIEVELRVGFGPLTFYRYRHDNRERWRAGRFVSFSSVTDDNGTRLAARAERSAEGIAVEGVEGAFTAPAEAWPTTYWYAGFLDRSVWVDTQFGRLRRSRVVPAGTDRVPVGGGEVLAERVRLEGELALELWYHAGRWVGLAAALPDGSALSYRLLTEPAPALAAAG